MMITNSRFTAQNDDRPQHSFAFEEDVGSHCFYSWQNK